MIATLTAVELLKRGCTATFDVSGEFPQTTPAGPHTVVAPMMADRTLWQAYPELLQSLPAERPTWPKSEC